MRRLVVALCGRRRVGKDVVAQHLVDVHGFAHLKISLALKQACALIFGLEQAQIEGREKDAVDPRFGVTPRQLMQRLGTIVSQDIAVKSGTCGPASSFWLRTLLERELPRLPRDQPVVLSDLRFVAESEALRACGQHEPCRALVVKLLRRQTIRRDSSCRSVDAHPSEGESERIDADVTIENDGAIADLTRKMDGVLRDARREEAIRTRRSGC